MCNGRCKRDTSVGPLRLKYAAPTPVARSCNMIEFRYCEEGARYNPANLPTNRLRYRVPLWILVLMLRSAFTGWRGGKRIAAETKMVEVPPTKPRSTTRRSVLSAAFGIRRKCRFCFHLFSRCFILWYHRVARVRPNYSFIVL